MKTPMQEHIEFMEREIKLLDDMPRVKKQMRNYIASLTICINNAKNMLEKEKEQIMNAYSDGLGNGQHFERGDTSDEILDEHRYFERTFNTKER